MKWWLVTLNKIVKLYVCQIHVFILHTAWIRYPFQEASPDEPTHNKPEAHTYRHSHAHVFTIHSGCTCPRACFWTVNKARVSSVVVIFCTWVLDKMYAKKFDFFLKQRTTICFVCRHLASEGGAEGPASFFSQETYFLKFS